MARRLVALAGLFCMLLHAGLVVAHHGLPDNPAGAALPGAGPAAADAFELARALHASMCRPAAHAGHDEAPPAPVAPAGEGAPCVVCCCPAAAAMVLPIPAPCPLPHVASWPEKIAWPLRPAATGSRVAERPPIRGPPVAS